MKLHILLVLRGQHPVNMVNKLNIVNMYELSATKRKVFTNAERAIGKKACQHTTCLLYCCHLYELIA
jgi:hypothetical protein